MTGKVSYVFLLPFLPTYENHPLFALYYIGFQETVDFC